MFELSKKVFEITSVVHGYRVYKDIFWEAKISSELPCSPEPDNHEHCYAMAILQLFQISQHSFIKSLSST